MRSPGRDRSGHHRPGVRLAAVAATAALLLSGCFLSAGSDEQQAADELPGQSAGWQGETFVVDENFQVEYGLQNDMLHLRFTLSNDKTGWMGMTFHNYPYPGDWIVAWWDPVIDEALVWDAFNPGSPTLAAFPSPVQDTDPAIKVPDSTTDNKDNVEIVSASNEDGVITIEVQRPRRTGDVFDFPLAPGHRIKVLAAYNDSEVFTEGEGVVQPPASVEASTTAQF